MIDPDLLYDKHGFALLDSEIITIDGREGFAQVSLQVLTGTITLTGAAGLTIGGKACGTVTIPVGVTFTFGTGLSTVDDLTIDATNGTALIAGVRIRNVI